MAKPAEAPSTDGALALLTACATLLFVNGQTTERTIASLTRLGRALGLSVSAFPRWGELALRIEDASPAGAPRHEVVAAVPAGVEMNKVSRTTSVVDALCDGRTSPADALAELDAVARLAPVSLARFALLAAAGAVALAVIFGATDLPGLGLIALSAGAGACLRRGLARLSSNPLPQPLGAALLAGLVGALASRLMPQSAFDLVALCPCMVLVPGPHILNGVLDLARLRIGLGAARIGYAGLIVLLICVGLIAGLSLGETDLPIGGAATPVPFAYDVVAAGVAVAAYGTFFSMPWRTLPIPVAVGMTAHACRWVAMANGAGLTLGALVACLFVGATVTPIANRLRLPFAAVAFAAVVALIPGVFLFRMAADFIAVMRMGAAAPPAALVAPIADGVTATVVILAMAFGLILPKMLIEHAFPVWSGVAPAAAAADPAHDGAAKPERSPRSGPPPA